jgi:hypothetical protein
MDKLAGMFASVSSGETSLQEMELACPFLGASGKIIFQRVADCLADVHHR